MTAWDPDEAAFARWRARWFGRTLVVAVLLALAELLRLVRS